MGKISRKDNDFLKEIEPLQKIQVKMLLAIGELGEENPTADELAKVFSMDLPPARAKFDYLLRSLINSDGPALIKLYPRRRGSGLVCVLSPLGTAYLLKHDLI